MNLCKSIELPHDTHNKMNLSESLRKCNGKIEPINPIIPSIFSLKDSLILLSPFKFHSNFVEEFELKNQEERQDIITKEYSLDLYINSKKYLQRLVYYKNEYKGEKVIIENFIDINKIGKRRKTNENNENIFRQTLKSIGINYDNILKFESNFESGNLNLAYLVQSEYQEVDNIKNFTNENNNQKLSSSNKERKNENNIEKYFPN